MEIEMKIRKYKDEDVCFPQDIKHFMFNKKKLSIIESEQFIDELYLVFSNENKLPTQSKEVGEKMKIKGAYVVIIMGMALLSVSGYMLYRAADTYISPETVTSEMLDEDGNKVTYTITYGVHPAVFITIGALFIVSCILIVLGICEAKGKQEVEK